MLIASIQTDFDAIKRLFRDVIITTNYSILDNVVSWRGYQSGIIKNFTYVLEYDRLVGNRQYSFLFRDKSFVQFYYEWADDGVSIARIAYYPRPFEDESEPTDAGPEALSPFFEQYVQALLEEPPYSLPDLCLTHFRIDYARGRQSHPECHLQLGGLHELRVPMRYLIPPLTFLDFIAGNMWPKHHQARSGSADYIAALRYSRSQVERSVGTTADGVYATHSGA